jgi:hypothetical protein
MLILSLKLCGNLKKLDFKNHREKCLVHLLKKIITFFDILSNYDQKRLFSEQSLFYVQFGRFYTR